MQHNHPVFSSVLRKIRTKLKRDAKKLNISKNMDDFFDNPTISSDLRGIIRPGHPSLLARLFPHIFVWF